MKKIIIIKYGELSTKKDNINFFISKLKNNISIILKNIDSEIKYDFGRMFIKVNEKDIDSVVNKLKKVFGILEIIIGYIDNELEIEKIKNNTLSLINDKNFNTFKVITKRSDKNYPINSMEINNVIGGFLLKNIPNIKIDVHNP